MKPAAYASAFALAISAGWALPAHAQSADAAAVQQELAAMREQMARMAARIDMLEGQLAEASSSAEAATTAASEAGEQAAAAARLARGSARVKWKGAPEIEGEGGWSFKPRGRILVDAGITDSPDSTGRKDGYGAEARRVRLGMEGSMPGGFGYKMEADFSQNEVQLTDAFLTYTDKGLTVTIGQHNNLQSLDEMTSSNNSSFMERAAFTDAFGFERRVGVSAHYTAGPLLLEAGVFADNSADLPGKNRGADARVVFMPKSGKTQLHFGGSLHYTDLDPANASVRYRQRPMVHFTGNRFIDTGTFAARSEKGLGLEAAAISGRFHAAAEGFWQKVSRPGVADPTFFGGYAEAGVFLTKGDTRGYKGGLFGRVKPKSPVGSGGIGAVQVAVRYDHLDLTDAGIAGGRQNGFHASLIWTPTDYVRFLVNYGHNSYRGAAVATSGGDRSYGVDVAGMRAQIDF